MATLMCYVCVQLYAYVTCGQVSVKSLYDIYEPYTYITPVHKMKYWLLFLERFTVTDLILCMHVFI